LQNFQAQFFALIVSLALLCNAGICAELGTQGAGHSTNSGPTGTNRTGKSNSADSTSSSCRVGLGRSEVRKLHFPKQSIGSLILMETYLNPSRWPSNTRGKVLCGACGDITVTVPGDKLLALDASNRKIYENPHLLEEISPNGIDALRLSFISMDDQEDDMLARALGCVHHLQGLRALYVDRSEATDKGLAKLKNMPHLACINCFLTGVTGACFKDLPQLSAIDVTCCNIDPKNLVYLAQMPNLRILNVAQTHLDKIGSHYLAKCAGLVELYVGNNAQFDDGCLQDLVPLRKLQSLGLSGTGITLNGLKILRGRNFKELTLPSSMRTNKTQLESMFPGAQVMFGGNGQGKLSKDDATILAPLR
jgi:hypothetical protein